MIGILQNDDTMTIPIPIMEYKALVSSATVVNIIKGLILDDSSSSAIDLSRKIMAVIRSGEAMYAVTIKEDND